MMNGIPFRFDDLNITIRRINDTFSIHCYHGGADGDGNSFYHRTVSEDNFWEMVKTHIRVHHTKESADGKGKEKRNDIQGHDAIDSKASGETGQRDQMPTR